jgi:hypothetical protein
MSAYPGAALPYRPFPYPIPVPASDITDEPTYQLCINVQWIKVLIGLANTLTAQSTWKSDDPAEVDRGCNNGFELLHLLTTTGVCELPIEFRVDPGDDRRWDYSTDGGASWIEQPLTSLDTMTDVVKTDPSSDLVNTIAAASGIDGLTIEALAAFGAKLRSSAVAHFMEKDTVHSPTSDGVMQIRQTGDYTYPLIEVIT